MKRPPPSWALGFALVLFASACSPPISQPGQPTASAKTATAEIDTREAPAPVVLNPLTGLPAYDPANLRIPAVLVSISHFPAIGRPQAGLSFAPIVYEVPITEGATRFLAIFFGEFPSPEAPAQGDCPVRSGAFQAAGLILGNRVWLDEDADGIQDSAEQGVGGVCLRILDPHNVVVAQTTTDSNGYYGFTPEAGDLTLEVLRPPWARLSPTGVGDASKDSDSNPVTGRDSVQFRHQDLSHDAGLVPLSPTQSATAHLPAPQIGPIRSGRLVFGYIARSFERSCLIFAGASPEVLARLPTCHLVFHQEAGGGYMLDISELKDIARQNAHQRGRQLEYGTLRFSDSPSAGGEPARRLDVYYAYQNQSAWVYDPLYGAYLRYVDTSEYDKAGILHPDSDRLTGRQLHFENVIVLFVEHDVLSPTNLDIRLNPGRIGRALVLRDGEAFEAQWDMSRAGGNHPTPMQIVNENGEPFPLSPGHTWFLIVTPESSMQNSAPATLQLRFAAPPTAK